MAKIRFYGYSLASKGLKELKKELTERGHHCLSIKKTNSSYRYHPNHWVINWGLYREPFFTAPPERFINGHVDGVKRASNKLKAFNSFKEHDVPIPRYCNNTPGAAELFNHGEKVYCRTKLEGSKGIGIVVANSVDELVEAPLYTQGIDIKHEYRVHVFNGVVIDAVMKRKMRSERIEEEGITLNMDVRNHDNGWVFARADVSLSEDIKSAAYGAVEACGLTFGAVDVVTDHYDNPVVIEVNTAPGLVGTTILSYSDAICQYISSP